MDRFRRLWWERADNRWQLLCQLYYRFLLQQPVQGVVVVVVVAAAVQHGVVVVVGQKSKY
jgi:hypothetical protein